MSLLDAASGGQGQLPDDQAQPDFEQHDKLLAWIDSPNIAEELTDEKLAEIGQKVKREYDIDVDSRSDWKTKTDTAMNLAMQVAKEKQYPWPKASNVIFPLMTTAAMQFAARAYPAIVAGKTIVKGIAIGPDNGTPLMGPNGQPVPGPDGQPVMQIPPGAKRERASKIGEHMSWQLIDEQPEWEPETDRLLHVLPIVGCAFRKSYFDPEKGRNASLMVSALNVVINYHAKSLESAPRVTEELRLYPVEIEEKVRAGIFLDVELGTEPEAGQDDDAPRDFIEQHRWLDLDDDDYPEPYIVTVHKASSKVVRVVARYDQEGVKFSGKSHKIARIEPVHYYTQYDFLPNPEGGIYGVGFGQLLRPINEAVNTTLNLLIDSGHLANTGGGFIGKGLSMNTGAIKFQPGEYKMVNVSGSVVKDSIVPLQFPGPSMVLFQLLGLMIDAGKDVASVKDVLTGEQQQHNVPATTTLALIEQGLKVFTAIYKRVYRGLKEEYKKLYRLNRLYLPMEVSYRMGDDWRSISQQDYALGSGVEPISDPSMVSDMQRLGKAQFLMQFAQDPMFNGMEIRHRILEAAQIDNIDRLLVPPQEPMPLKIKQAELAQKDRELAMQERSKRATEIRDYSQAILNLANADSVVGDQHIQWLNQQLQVWETQFEHASQPPPVPGPDGQPAPQGPQAPLPPPPQLSPAPMPHTGVGIAPQGGPPGPPQQGGAPGAPNGMPPQ